MNEATTTLTRAGPHEAIDMARPFGICRRPLTTDSSGP